MGYISFFRQNAPWLTAAMLLTFSSSYGQTFFISVFAGEIRAEFGLSHGEWGATYTLGTAASAVAMIWAGTLTDKYRIRILAPIVLVILALASLAMASVSQAWMLVPVIFLLRLAGQGMLGHIGMVATARWFIASRGRALSIASLGFSIGNAVLPLGFVALLGFVGWRSLWVLVAGLVILAIPALKYLLQQERTPQSISVGDESTGMGGLHWTRKMLLKHWLFWSMIPVLIGPPAWSTSLFFQQVHLASVKGWQHLEFVALFPLFTAVMVVTTIAVGPAIDRFGANRILPFYLMPYVAAFFVLSGSTSLMEAALGLALMGISAGFGSSVVSAFWAEHCGTRHLGSVKSMAAAIMVFGSAIGPGITGFLIDNGIDFPRQMIWIAWFFAISALVTAYACHRARPLLPASTKVNI